MNERAYLRRIKSVPPHQLSALAKTSDPEEQRVLRTYLGAEQFAALQNLKPPQSLQPGAKVVILPGILGSELWEPGEEIWLDAWSIIKGDFDQLQVNPDGTSRKQITAPNALNKYYGLLASTLAQNWSVTVFPFDWRLEIRDSAKLLRDLLTAVTSSGDRTYFVAHSMGGLVVRWMFQQFPEEQARMQRFIMLGTPNLGSYAIPKLYSGLDGVLKLVALADFQHFLDMDALLQFAKWFVGTYEMLPFLGASPDADRLLDSNTYGPDLNAPQERFDNARDFQTKLGTALPLDRCTYIAGFGQSTEDGIADWARLTLSDGYRRTMLGDGTVPHSLGLMSGMPAYFINEEHSKLPANQSVIAAVGDILQTGATNKLPNSVPSSAAITAMALPAGQQTLQAAHAVVTTRTEARVRELRDRILTRKSIAPSEISHAEIELQDILYTGHSNSSPNVPD